MKINKKIFGALLIAVFATTFTGHAALASEGNDNSGSNSGSDHSGKSGSGFMNSFTSFGARLFHNGADDKDKDDKDHKEHGLHHRANLIVVTSIDGDTIMGDTAIGHEAGQHWIVNTNADTSFLSRTGESTTFADVDVGDTITFHGDLANTIQSSSDDDKTVNANSIRVWGDVDVTNVIGIKDATVTDVNDANMELTVTTSDGREITVLASDRTKIGSNASTSNSFADIQEGMTISFKGFWNAVKDKLTAFKIKFM